MYLFYAPKKPFKNNYMIYRKPSFKKYFYYKSIVKLYSSLIIFLVKKGKCINIKSQEGNHPFRTARLCRSPDDLSPCDPRVLEVGS